MALSGLGRKQEAIKCFEEAILINPNDEDYHFNMGSVLNDLNRLEDAV
jgi:tetratricopeptide (TPR) repeat protein